MAEYIEREALLTEIAKGTIITDDSYGMGIMAGVDAVSRMVMAQPAADVAPVVRGRWVGSAFDMACSACGIYQSFHVGRTKFCPNCGADMREG